MLSDDSLNKINSILASLQVLEEKQSESFDKKELLIKNLYYLLECALDKNAKANSYTGEIKEIKNYIESKKRYEKEFGRNKSKADKMFNILHNRRLLILICEQLINRVQAAPYWPLKSLNDLYQEDKLFKDAIKEFEKLLYSSIEEPIDCLTKNDK